MNQKFADVTQAKLFQSSNNEFKQSKHHQPIDCNTLGSIIFTICWFSFAICAGFTFFDMSPPTKTLQISNANQTRRRSWNGISPPSKVF